MRGRACIRRLIGNRTRANNMDKPQLNATAIVRMIKEGAVSLMGPWPRDIEVFIFSVGQNKWRWGFSPVTHPSEANYVAKANEIAASVRERYDILR
jgi:hypothetical protein